MARARKLRITVDQASVGKIRGISPLEGGRAVATKIVEVPADKVRRELRRALATMREVLEDAITEAKGYELDEVSFNLRLEASGRVSLLSIASGNVSASTGVQFRFRRRDEK